MSKIRNIVLALLAIGYLGFLLSSNSHAGVAPVAPTIDTHPASADNDATPNFTFSGVAGNTFKCSMDNAVYATATTCTSPFTSSTLTDGSHTFYVWQVDGTDTPSASPASYTWTIDTVKPAWPVIDSSPASSSPTKVVNNIVSFTGDPGVTFECKLNTAAWAACTSPQSFTGQADGSYTLSIRAKDDAGNYSAEPDSATTWTVDTTAPAAPGINGIPDRTIHTGAMFTLTKEANATVECRLDGAGSWSACPQYLTYNNLYVYTSLAVGIHQLSVRQTDQAGNVGTSAVKNWTIVGPEGLCPGPTTPSQAVHTYRSKGRWYFQLGDRFLPGDSSKPCTYLMTVQINFSVAQPSNSLPIPTKPSHFQGIVSWGSLVSRAGTATPHWVRVGSRTGKWTNWVPIHWVHAP